MKIYWLPSYYIFADHKQGEIKKCPEIGHCVEGFACGELNPPWRMLSVDLIIKNSQPFNLSVANPALAVAQPFNSQGVKPQAI
jgi:hypothetical protein